MRALDPTQTSTRHESLAFGFLGYRTRKFERVVDAMYAPAATFDAWCKRVATSAALAFERALDVSVTSFAGEPALRIDDLPTKLRISGEISENEGIVLSVRYEGDRRPFRYDRALLLRVALHLENAAAIKTTRQLRGTVGWNDRALVVNDRAPRDLWVDLAHGRASLACTDLNATRFFIVDAPFGWSRHRALTELESNVVKLAAAGLQYKIVAHRLGISAPSVSRALAIAAAKIGVRGPCQLLRIASRLAVAKEDDRGAPADDRLTDTEREILALVVAGHSNRAIAELRGRSARTIANQVASLLHKTGCASRRALATLHRG